MHFNTSNIRSTSAYYQLVRYSCGIKKVAEKSQIEVPLYLTKVDWFHVSVNFLRIVVVADDEQCVLYPFSMAQRLQ